MARPKSRVLARGALVLAILVGVVWGALFLLGLIAPTEEPYQGNPQDAGNAGREMPTGNGDEEAP